jgi:hypothetical protein
MFLQFLLRTNENPRKSNSVFKKTQLIKGEMNSSNNTLNLLSILNKLGTTKWQRIQEQSFY